MSWHFEVKATTKEEAKALVVSDPSVKDWNYCPRSVVLAVNALIDALPYSSDKIIHVSTSGHIEHNFDGVPVDSGMPTATIRVDLGAKP